MDLSQIHIDDGGLSQGEYYEDTAPLGPFLLNSGLVQSTLESLTMREGAFP